MYDNDAVLHGSETKAGNGRHRYDAVMYQ